MFSFIVYLLHRRILCFPRSRISYQDIIHLGSLWHQISGFLIIHHVFLVWCLENHFFVLSVSILIRLGYIREHVELSWIKTQNKRRCLVTWDQGPTVFKPIQITDPPKIGASYSDWQSPDRWCSKMLNWIKEISKTLVMW